MIDRTARDNHEARSGFAALPVRVQVLDRLADLMLDADDILDLLQTPAANDLRTISRDIESIRESLNALMHRFSD